MKPQKVTNCLVNTWKHTSFSGWWQLKYCLFSPHYLGFHDPILTIIIFQMGWNSTTNYMGVSSKWWYPQNTPKWSFLVGKPMVVGETHHFRKPPYRHHSLLGTIFQEFTSLPFRATSKAWNEVSRCDCVSWVKTAIVRLLLWGSFFFFKGVEIAKILLEKQNKHEDVQNENLGMVVKYFGILDVCVFFPHWGLFFLGGGGLERCFWLGALISKEKLE